MNGDVFSELAVPRALRGRSAAWGRAGRVVLILCVAVGLWLRLRGLAVEGFADDEVHKWLAATRYLRGDFGGDDVEHPMLMKWLIALAAAVLPRSMAPEAITRLPNAIAGGVSVWAVAQLGRRLFSRGAGLIAAGLAATSVTWIGYQRIAKEDTLLGLFLLLFLWCFAEAKAASTDGRGSDQRRWENAGAICFGLMLASKYYLHYLFIPVLAWVWIARQDQSTWRLTGKRWLSLVGMALVAFSVVNWTPFMPSTYRYYLQHLGGTAGDDRWVSESLWFMGRLWGNLVLHYRDALPVWFYPVFFAVKLVPLTLVFAVGGLGLALWRRGTAERILLTWLGFWFVSFLLTGAKYGRVTVSAMPALFLLAALAAVELTPALAAFAVRLSGGAMTVNRRGATAMAVVLGVALAGAEAWTALAHVPHYRLYINAIGGGDRNLGYFFPHCDYFDAGLRETVAWIAAHAEPAAEITSEVEWPVRYYANQAGRSDLNTSPFTLSRGCRSGHPCYVIAQAGRLYWHNQAALEQLAHTAPVHVERINGAKVVEVYRLEPNQRLFPEGP